MAPNHLLSFVMTLRRSTPFGGVLLAAILSVILGACSARTGGSSPDLGMPGDLGDGAAQGSEWDLSSTVDATTDAALLGGSDGAGGPGDGAADGSVEPFHYYDVNHVLSTGQSLSLGTEGAPALSTSQPYHNVMFNTGVIAGGTGLTSFTPLAESGYETISSGLANLVTTMATSEPTTALPPPDHVHNILVSCHGVGGTAYVGLMKGTAAYANGMAQVSAGISISKASALSYAVRAVTVIHGEADHVSGNTHYASDVETWQQNYESDVRAMTGQTIPVPLFHTQVSSWTFYGDTTSLIPGAQLQAAVESPGKVILVGPKYFLTYADGIHLTNESYRRLGEYYAKAYRAVVLERRAWEPLRPIAVTRSGAVIRVQFIVPSPPLAFDTGLISDPGNFGFEYADDSTSPPPITDVHIEAPDTVRITLLSEPTGQNRHIRYAFTGKAGALAGPLTGPRGNLRDSDQTKSPNNYTLYNWAVHFDESVP